MDAIAQYNTRIIKEPRGMIRIIQLVFAILAFATTSGFDTQVTFRAICAPASTEYKDSITKAAVLDQKIRYIVEYPFKFEDQEVRLPKECPANSSSPVNYTIVKLNMEFASSAQFFVATGVLSFLYTIGCLVVYIFGTRHYESNPLIPVIDFAGSIILTIFWLAGACAWAAGVSDVKHYTNPEKLMKNFDFCNNKVDEGSCLEDSPGKWASLNISLIFGFANIFLWAASLWFVFKETSFHQRQVPADQIGARPPTSGFGAFGDQASAQQQIPSQQTHFPQPKQFADGY